MSSRLLRSTTRITTALGKSAHEPTTIAPQAATFRRSAGSMPSDSFACARITDAATARGGDAVAFFESERAVGAFCVSDGTLSFWTEEPQQKRLIA